MASNNSLNAISRGRQFVPRPVFEFARRTYHALATPFYWSSSSGHFISAVRGRALDRHGKAVPWYSYPAIDLLLRKDFTGKRVVEFGAGQSTLWWAKRAAQVTAFEDNLAWHNYLVKLIPENVELLHSSDKVELEARIKGKLFDVAIIDGLDRQSIAQQIVDYLAPESALIIDNSEGYGFEGFESITEYFGQFGFSRVDFYGHAPGLLGNHCTSVLFRGKCFLFEGMDRPTL